MMYAEANKGYYPQPTEPYLDPTEISPPPQGPLQGVYSDGITPFHFNQAGWGYRLTKPGYLGFNWESYSRRQGVLWCPTDETTGIDPTFWGSYHIATLSSYNHIPGTVQDSTIPDPVAKGAGSWCQSKPPCKITMSPKVTKNNLRARSVAPMMVCQLKGDWTGRAIHTTLANSIGYTKHSKNAATSVLYNDCHVEFGQFYSANPGDNNNLQLVYPGSPKP